MNAPVASPIEKFRQQVLPPDKAQDLWRALPGHIKPAVFERNLVNALMQNPQLIEFHPGLVYREVSKAAGLGLLLDPQLGEAYIVTAWNGRTKRVEPQLRIGYKGMCKLARQAGDVTNIYAHEVCAKDKIECHLGADKKLIHVPDLFGDRGAVVGYYAVIKYANGSFDFEPMTVKQCRDIRDRSDAWKAFQEGKIKSTPWATDESEMSKKTVLRRLMKRQEQSPELAEALRIEDTADFAPMRDITPRSTANDGPPAPSAVGKIEHHKTAPMADVHRDRDMELVEAGHSEPGDVIWGEADAPPTAPDQTSEDQWLKDLVGAFSGCEDMVSFGEKQRDVMAPMRAKVSPDAWQKAQGLAEDHFKRIQQSA